MTARASALLVALAAACGTAPVVPARPAAPAPAPAPGAPASPPGPMVPAVPWAHLPPPPPLAAQEQPAPKVASLTLPNRLRVVVQEEHRRPILSASVVFPRGALLDPPEDAGLTHLAVTLATTLGEPEELPVGQLAEKSVIRQAVELGGSLRAVVDADSARLQISGYSSELTGVLRLLASAVREPRRGPNTFIAVRQALRDEADQEDSSDPEVLDRALSEASFGVGHTYSRSVVGTSTTLRGFGLEDVHGLQESLFVPDGATLLVVGDVQPAAVFDLARSAFGRWQGTATPLPAALPSGRAQEPSAVLFLERARASVLVTCASRPLQDFRGSDAALDLFAGVLGGGTAGRLAQALREEAGLTYATQAGIVRMRQGRAFLACAMLHATEATAGIGLLRRVLEEMVSRPPSPAELARARAQALARLEDGGGVAQAAAAWHDALRLGQQAPPGRDRRAELERVTPEEVRRVAQALLKKGTLRWVLSGDRVAAAKAVRESGLGRLVAYQPGT